jgi:surfeit locus 1 family protein
MAQHLDYGLLPFYVQAEVSEDGVLPIAEVPSLDLTEGPHLGYAVQWFGFALILAIGYPAYVRRQEKAEA